MGLDMYLNGKIYLSVFNDEHSNLIKEIHNVIPLTTEYASTKKQRIEHNSIRLEGLTVSLAYWRKANQIHKWFVENAQNGVDDCTEFVVTDDQLDELYDLCKLVLLKNQHPSNILPSHSGFFFGRTDYDEWYFQDIESTIEQIDQIRTLQKRSIFKQMDIYYHSSW
jgi:hypothetical protein